MKRINLLMTADEIDRVLSRITHQILEQVPNLDDVAIIGMQTKGVYLAKVIQDKINKFGGKEVPMGILDTALYRDDFRFNSLKHEVRETDIPFDIKDKTILLIDDVLYTGRTVRAALDAIMDLGRPKAVRFIALVDKGHRELPIRADYVGKKMTTADNQMLSFIYENEEEETALWLVERD